jgi:adenylate cyclase
VNIIVSENTYSHTKDQFLYRKLDKVQVKGKQTAVLLFEPLCLIQEASEPMKKEAEAHNEAIDAYIRGDWDRAREIWSTLSTAGENPKLYQMYLERFASSPNPGPDWDGVQKYETK